MSNRTNIQEELDQSYAEIGDNDYVFILGPDGKLKQIILPDEIPFEQPENVTKLLDIFNITDADNLDGSATLH